MKIRQSASIYFAIQGIAVISWWLFLLLFPSFRIYFQMDDNSEATLLAFWLPDLLLLAVGSLITSRLCFVDNKLASIASWFVSGTVSYATLYCLAFALLTDQGWLGTTLMLVAMLWSGVCSIGLSSAKDLMFRQAEQSKTSWILTKTSIQIVIVWGIVLFIIPFLIVQLEGKLGVLRFNFPFQQPLATIFFLSISFLGLASAFTMSRIGKGTPLPLDTARNLVISGTYAYVRNPMAISGVGQGLTVGLWLGSPLVLIYALMGGLIWQLIFRPLEETDLLERFGEDYENYRRRVRCWFPHLKPYQIEATAASSISIESPSGRT